MTNTAILEAWSGGLVVRCDREVWSGGLGAKSARVLAGANLAIRDGDLV